VGSYQQGVSGSFDQSLKDMLASQQIKDAKEKRTREQKMREAIAGSYRMVPTAQGIANTQTNIDPSLLEGMSAEQVVAASPMTRVMDRDKLLSSIAEFAPEKYLELTKDREPKETYRVLTAEEKKQIGAPADATLQISSSGKISQIGSGPLVKVDASGGKDFFGQESQKLQAQNFSEIVKSGTGARRTLNEIKRLEGFLDKTPSGLVAGAKVFAGNFGIPTEGLSDLQAAQAIINRLVPQQRPPGSGTMSDADLALFKSSLPRIINQPGGNKLIIQTIRGLNEYLVQEGEIASQVMNRKISPEEGQRKLAELPNPLENFNQSVNGGNAAPSQFSTDDTNLVNKYLNPKR
jgi:hypothetical protein